ncbi:hypothetical protein GCM10028895_07670 [Pontibacter rugosus]
MRPEDIDKIFKERLGNNAPTPPADMWARLQERMEDEKPVMGIVQDEKTAVAEPQVKKRSIMWMYSSIAATLSLLLAVSVVFYNINTGTPEINNGLTKHDVMQPEQSVVVPSAPEETVGGIAYQQPVESSDTETEKNLRLRQPNSRHLHLTLQRNLKQEKPLPKQHQRLYSKKPR